MLTNAALAELAARRADDEEGNKRKALKRLARKAFLWPQEAWEVARTGRTLTELAGVGPWLERTLLDWFAAEPDVPEPPESRRDFLTLVEAESTVETNATWRAELRGDLQMHSTYSDGTTSIAELAAAAATLGHEYIAVTDHSKGLRIAGGIDEDELARQGEEIAALNKRLEQEGSALRVLRGLELNLDTAGEGDMDEQALLEVDVVIGSFHSQLRKKDDQTDRYLAALANPSVCVLGHPKGRIYDHRVGLRADWRRVFELAVALDKAVEIDCYPDRQDLSVELLEVAAQTGVRVSIGTDAHHPAELAFVVFGLAAALHADVPRERILNFAPREDVVEWSRTVRASA